MAEIQPFQGWRYDVSQIGNLSEVTAPPYDVIGDEQQDALYKRHPCNCIRLILNRDEPSDTEVAAKYGRAAGFLQQWQSDGVLMQEREDALYVYHQVFDWEGVHYVRKGFLTRVRLEEFGEGSVFPHEQTMPGPKADRLALTTACKMNLSPIFGLFPDSDAEAQNVLETAVADRAPREVEDDLGVLHRLWPVTETDVIDQVRGHLAERPIFIADGHHRYETALNYRRQRKEEGTLEDDVAPANFVLMTLVGMNDPGLAVLPTHRLVSGIPDVSVDDLKDMLSEHFEVEIVSEGADRAWELMEQRGTQNVFGFAAGSDNQWLFARLTDPSPMETLAADESPEWRALGVSILHRFILDHLLQKRFPESTAKCKYVHELSEVAAAVEAGSTPLACLVMPAGVDHVREIASKLEKMPPKSTFFYPKLLSGLVFNPVD
jgi:uncharacterized protein (DUF1015 family)